MRRFDYKPKNREHRHSHRTDLPAPGTKSSAFVSCCSPVRNREPQAVLKTVRKILPEKRISPCLSAQAACPPWQRVSVKGLPIFSALNSSRGISQRRRRPSGSSRVWKRRGRKQEAVRGEPPADAEPRHRPGARAASLLSHGTATRQPPAEMPPALVVAFHEILLPLTLAHGL